MTPLRSIVLRPFILRSITFMVVLAGAAACGSDTQTGIGCSNPVREALDSQSGIHVLDANAVTYLTDPPTSGPHAGAAPGGGSSTESIPKPVQVALLESGGVMVQYGALSDVARAKLHELADGVDLVVVSPGVGFEPNRVVATAWLNKLECRGVDIAALSDFMDDRLGALVGHG